MIVSTSSSGHLPRPVTLLTDFGTSDYYVAAVKGTLLRLAPGCQPVDISHEVPPGDVETAAFLLGAAAFTFPPRTVHLAVVDPGVGSERRILVAAARGSYFVAPDNGLLTPVLGLDPGAVVHRVDLQELYLPGPGSTFHGRDRFAPVAAYLLRGHSYWELGPAIEDPVRLPLSPPRQDGQTLHGKVIHIDRFGNLVTDLPSAWLPAGAALRAEVAGQVATRQATHYREIPPAEAAVLPGSLGTLELSLDGDHLARRWGARRGDPVRIDLL